MFKKAAFIACCFDRCSARSNKPGRISQHVAISGCSLVHPVTVHTLRKFVAAGSGHY